MLHRFLIFFSITLLLSACYGNKKPEKPENLISKEDMVNILMDIKILASATGINKDILDQNGVEQEDFIYEKYHIDSLQFSLSNAYYSYYTVQYESIYAKVNDSLTRLKELFSIQNERELEEKRIQDSLANIAVDSTLIETKILNKEELKDSLLVRKVLIEPVSENDLQPQ